MKKVLKFIFICIVLFGCTPTYKGEDSGALLDDLEISIPDDCTPLSPQVYVASPNNKKTIAYVDGFLTPELVTGDPVFENLDSGSWGSITASTVDPPPDFSNYNHLVTDGRFSRKINFTADYSGLAKEDIVFISFYVKSILNNNIYNGTNLTVKYVSSSSSSDELERMVLTVPLTNQWQRVYYPVRIDSDTVTLGKVEISSPIDLAQEFYIGGFSFKNFKQTIPFLDFPNFEEYYNGIEENAQWRIDALARIQDIRMKDVNISFKDQSGNSLKEICVKVEQLRHKFSFAGAVETYDPGSVWYEQHFTLFNETTMRNAQKWKASSKNELDDETVRFADNDQYLNPAIARGNVIRSHAVLWPKFDNTPTWIKGHLHEVLPVPTDKDDCKFTCDDTCKTNVNNAFRDHISTVLNYYKGIIYEWDFINEPNDGSKNNTGYNGDCILGKDIMYEWIEYGRSIDQNLSIAINEYGLIYQTGMNVFNRKFPLIEEMVNTDKSRNPPNGFIDAIGLQGHYNGAESIPEIQNKIDLLSALNKKIKLTEADIFMYNEDTQGKFMRDLIILFYASPSFDGITFWNWHYDPTRLGEKALERFFRSDGTMRPMASQYMDTIYNRFWIRESKGIDSSYSNRLYYGDYEVTATVGGVEYTQTVKIEKGGPSDIELTLTLP